MFILFFPKPRVSKITVGKTQLNIYKKKLIRTSHILFAEFNNSDDFCVDNSKNQTE